MPMSHEHDIFEDARKSLPADANPDVITNAYQKARYLGSNSDLARTGALTGAMACDRHGIIRPISHATDAATSQTQNAPVDGPVQRPPWSDEAIDPATPIESDESEASNAVDNAS